jgi:hypothetical protein
MVLEVAQQDTLIQWRTHQDHGLCPATLALADNPDAVVPTLRANLCPKGNCAFLRESLLIDLFLASKVLKELCDFFNQND